MKLTRFPGVGAPLVGASDSCFLSDAAILGLYSFSFNISDNGNDFAPQCSNLTLSWPTSLEQNVTGFDPALNSSATASDADGDDDNEGETPSSSKHHGNTTYPPTLFGVIPLGNSFSIPITYDEDVPFASSLPASSLSETPTTWTAHGVTSLNWTVQMARGTRFILVAGIGSNSQWASGGSSQLMTVGQGSTTCSTNNQGDVPSITATGTSTSDPTSTDPPANGGGPPAHSSNLARIVVACVVSVLGTLIIVGLLVFCLRMRRKRRERMNGGTSSPGGLSKKLGRSSTQSPIIGPGEAIDLTSFSDSSRSRDMAPQYDDAYNAPGAGPYSIPSSPIQYQQPHLPSSAHGQAGPSRPFLRLDTPGTAVRGFEPGTYTTTGTYSSPISPMGASGSISLGHVGSSQDALLNKARDLYSSSTPTRSSTPPPLPERRGTAPRSLYPRQGTLQLHEQPTREAAQPDDREDQHVHGSGNYRNGQQYQMEDLKVETIAALDHSSPQVGQSSSVLRGDRRRRRRRDDDDGEMEYVVHRDAGRVARGNESTSRRVELPPRYEELDWDREGREPDETRTA